MTDPHDETRLWPTSPFHLGDAHRCPSCFVVVSAQVCPNCGLTLTDPRAARVLELGRDMLAAELARQELMVEIRLAHRPIPEPEPDPVPERVPALVPTVMTDAASAAPSHAPGPAAPAAMVPATPPAERAAVAASAPRRRLSVPVLLLIVGVSLVGVAAVFFLLVAWFVAGIAVRALIVGGITVATIGLASWLRRRRLAATAEGIGALGVVLLALDAWAVRANDLFGAGSTDAALYAGAATLVVAAVCRLWARMSHLHGPDLAASLALPTGLGLVVGGLAALPLGEAVTAGLLGAAVGGLAHALPAPWSSARSGAAGEPERLVLAVCGIGALVAAAITATTLTGSALPVVVWANAAVAVLSALHAWLLVLPAADRRLPAATALAGVAATTAVLMASTAGWQLAVRTGLPVYTLLVGPLVAVAVGFVIDVVRSRTPERAFRPAVITAVLVAGLSLAGEVIAWLWQAAAAIEVSWTQWRTNAFAVPSASADTLLLPATTAVAASLLLLVAPTLRRHGLREFRPMALAVLVIAAALYTAIPAVIVGASALVVAAALAVLAMVARRGGLTTVAPSTDAEPASTLRPGAGWAIAGATAAIVAYLAGTAAPWLWIVGIVVAAVYPVALCLLFRPAGGLAAVSAVAPVVVGAVSALLAPGALAAVTGATGRPDGSAVVAIALLQWVALAAFAAALWLRVDQTARTALAIAAEVLVAVTLAWTAVAAVAAQLGAPDAPPAGAIAEPALGIPRMFALVAVVSFIALGRTRIAPAPAVGAAALVAPTAAAMTFAVLGAFGARDAGWAPLVLTAAAAVVPAVSAVLVAARPLRHTGVESLRRRLAADAGAAAAVVTVVWGVSADLVWAAFAIVAVGLTAAAVTPGWAAPSRDDDRLTTRTVGMPAVGAPRRLLAWPALAAALAAWWSWLGGGTPATAFTLESYTVPAAVLLVGFACALTWLRRRLEASIALGLGLAIGLWSAAIDGWLRDPLDGPLGGTIAAGVAVAICLALSFTPLRGIRPASVVGASVAGVAVGLVAIDRALLGGWETLWLVVLVAVAYASGAGLGRATPSRASSRGYAVLAPVISLVAAVAAAAWLAREPFVIAGALTVLAALHLTAAAIDRAPFSVPTRWSALAGGLVIAAAGLAVGSVDEIEAVTLPLAAMCLGGSVLAMLRRRRRGEAWPGPETPVWLVGLGAATVPSLFAAGEPVRVWTLIAGALVAAGALAAWRVPSSAPAADGPSGFAALRVPSALLLAGAALAMGLRVLIAPALVSGPAAAFVSAIGALVVAILLTATAETEREGRVPAGLAAVGAALLAITTLTRTDGDLAQTAVIAAVGGIVGVCGASVLGLRRWATLGTVFAVGGALVTVVACGARFVSVARTPGGEADLWALAGAGIGVAIGAAALRATPSRVVAHVVGAGFAVGAVLYAAAVATLLATQPAGDGIRTVIAMSALTAATVLGVASRARLGRGLAVVGALAGAAVGVVALTAFGVSPAELVTIPPALGGIAYGAIALRRDPAARTWPALGPWLALLLVPSLLHDFGETALWRVVGLGLVAIALVVLGAVYRLQAPLVLGSAVLLVHAIAQLWPWISAAYVAVPWWLWLGLGGALLIFIAARYEQRVRAMRAAFVTVTSLR